MNISYSEAEAFFGDFQRISYSLSNGSPTTSRRGALASLSINDIIQFIEPIANYAIWKIKQNNRTYYIPSEELWSLYSKFDERIGIISQLCVCTICNASAIYELPSLEYEDFITITKNKSYVIKNITDGYRINYLDARTKQYTTEKDAFIAIETLLYNEKFNAVKGMTIKGRCIELKEL